MQRDQIIPQCAQVEPGSSGNIRKSGGWRDGSEVKSTDCSHIGPEFNSQKPHGGSQPSVMEFSGMETYMQIEHLCIKKSDARLPMV